jgi:hypothetical protein
MFTAAGDENSHSGNKEHKKHGCRPIHDELMTPADAHQQENTSR